MDKEAVCRVNLEKKILQIFSTLLFAITPFPSLALWPAPEMIINMYWQLVTMIYDIRKSSSKQVRRILRFIWLKWLSWCDDKFSLLIYMEIVQQLEGRINDQILELNG